MGRTSITMHVCVEAEHGQEVLQVTEAEVVYVGIDPNTPERKPTPLVPSNSSAQTACERTEPRS